MSAHHYFRDFVYCDSGMIPLAADRRTDGRRGRRLADLVARACAAFPSSGEINFRARRPEGGHRARCGPRSEPDAVARDETDGLSLAFATGG